MQPQRAYRFGVSNSADDLAKNQAAPLSRRFGPFTGAGLGVAAIMAVGSLLGIGLDSFLLKLEADDVRVEAEQQLDETIGQPALRDMAIQLLDEGLVVLAFHRRR